MIPVKARTELSKHQAPSPLTLLALLLLMTTVLIPLQTGDTGAGKSQYKNGFITVNGIKLHFLDWDGQGEALLFIAGSGDTAHAFDEIAPMFKDHFHVLALTRRGHGESDKPETGYDIPTLAEDVRRFLDALKIDRVNLVGHSAGGNELIQFASMYPKRMLKLIFLDAAYDRREVLALDAKDPFVEPPPADKRQAEYFHYMLEFKPEYKKIRAPALGFYAIYETHWALKPTADEATRKKAQEFIEKEVQPYQWRNIGRFRKEMVNGRVIVMRGTHHYFFRDPKRKGEVVHEMREFLLK